MSGLGVKLRVNRNPIARREGKVWVSVVSCLVIVAIPRCIKQPSSIVSITGSVLLTSMAVASSCVFAVGGPGARLMERNGSGGHPANGWQDHRQQAPLRARVRMRKDTHSQNMMTNTHALPGCSTDPAVQQNTHGEAMPRLLMYSPHKNAMQTFDGFWFLSLNKQL